MAVFTARDEHQSYPGRLHGGISATVLDETIGRAILIRSQGEVWGVTVEFTMRFKKPVPTDTARAGRRPDREGRLAVLRGHRGNPPGGRHRGRGRAGEIHQDAPLEDRRF